MSEVALYPLVSLSLRLKDLVGPVASVKKKRRDLVVLDARKEVLLDALQPLEQRARRLTLPPPPRRPRILPLIQTSMSLTDAPLSRRRRAVPASCGAKRVRCLATRMPFRTPTR